MASTYDIQHMFFKRQTGIENHTEQIDEFSEVNARPRDVNTFGQVKLWQPFARAKPTTASILSGFKSKAFSTNHLDTSTAQIFMADRSLKSSELKDIYSCRSSAY